MQRCDRRDAEIAETDAEMKSRSDSCCQQLLGVFLGVLGASAVAFLYVNPRSDILPLVTKDSRDRPPFPGEAGRVPVFYGPTWHVITRHRPTRLDERREATLRMDAI